MPEKMWNELEKNVIGCGLCTHCGTCVGLNPELLEFRQTEYGSLPIKSGDGKLHPDTYFACPGKGVPYPTLIKAIFDTPEPNYFSGQVLRSWIGYSSDPSVRLNSASGGIITSTLLYLLREKLIDGAVVLRPGFPRPELAVSIIATTEAEILASAQSIYYPVPVNTILEKTQEFAGKLAFVGLPDQVASIRMLQLKQNDAVRNIEYVLGPYTGTNMYGTAIRSFLRGRGVADDIAIKSLQWRAGEWPGYLEVVMEGGQTLRVEKFYYNYLTPFFITKSSLLACDFTNELTDISVGDAWSPKYENQRKGFSVVLARSNKGVELLEAMHREGLVNLERSDVSEILKMHGHMLDFKKRGSFIRMERRTKRKLPVPIYGYGPRTLSVSRKVIEFVVSAIFTIASKPWARNLSEKIPIAILGPVFNILRITWKKMSKPTKRKNLSKTEFIERKEELALLLMQSGVSDD